MAARILVVDDEPAIVDLLTYNLKRENFDVLVARDGEEALSLARQQQPDLVILDLMLPRLDGLEVCRTLRRERDVLIIMLTARDEEVDRIVGLELGADDYVVKPFSVRELMARVKNTLRRFSQAKSKESSEIIKVGSLTIDIGRHEVSLGDHQLELTMLEFDMLCALAVDAGRVLTRQQLLDRVWGYDYFGDTRVVDAVIKRLRMKLRLIASNENIIATIRNVGYKMQDNN